MTYQEIFKKVKTALAKADANAVSGKLAIEFDITGEGEGKFYVEVNEGRVNVEPYDYIDNDAKFIASAETLIAVAKGSLKPETAYADGSLAIDGNVGRALEFKALVESVPAPAPRKRRSKAEIEAEKAAKEAAKAVKEAAKAEKAAAPKKDEKPAAKKASAKKPAKKA